MRSKSWKKKFSSLERSPQSRHHLIQSTLSSRKTRKSPRKVWPFHHPRELSFWCPTSWIRFASLRLKKLWPLEMSTSGLSWTWWRNTFKNSSDQRIIGSVTWGRIICWSFTGLQRIIWICCKLTLSRKLRRFCWWTRTNLARQTQSHSIFIWTISTTIATLTRGREIMWTRF